MSKQTIFKFDMYISKDAILSPAFRVLSSTAKHIYMILCAERGLRRANVKVAFTRQEAKEKLGMSARRFKRAIDKLISVGLIDISKTEGDKYIISNRYRKH